MRRSLAIAAVFAIQFAGGAFASTAETQARLAAARPVTTEAVPAPPPPLSPHAPAARHEPVAGPPRPNLSSPESPAPELAPKPAPKLAARHDLGLVLLPPVLIALVALVRWFARRRRSASTRV